MADRPVGFFREGGKKKPRHEKKGVNETDLNISEKGKGAGQKIEIKIDPRSKSSMIEMIKNKKDPVFEKTNPERMTHILDAAGKRFDGTIRQSRILELEGKLKTPFKAVYWEGAENDILEMPQEMETPIGIVRADPKKHKEWQKRMMKKLKHDKHLLGINDIVITKLNEKTGNIDLIGYADKSDKK